MSAMSSLSSGASWLGNAGYAAVSRYSGGGSSSSPSRVGPRFDSGRDLDRMFHAKIRPLLDAVDQLRDVLRGESCIALPSIVVVGDQSSGKSSVLEELSGVSLPRGREITTRCPLVLRLINTAVDRDGNSIAAPTVVASVSNISDDPIEVQSPSPSPSHPYGASYAIISTISPNPSDGDRINNLADIAKCIESATSKIAGRGVGVVATPIYLSVYRAYSPDLTLIDLPGITRNPVGDQPKDIYVQIKSMIKQYITPESAIILNVMPATVDFPTCECVMLAKEVDPQSTRTIGVVTKLDLAEKGIRSKLQNGVDQLNLRLGVVGVRNRSNEDNEKGVTFEASRAQESAFFANHPELASLSGDFADRIAQFASDSCVNGGLFLGTSNLAALLTVIQEQRIRQTLPKIKLKCRDILADYKAKYRLLPSGHVASGSDARVKIEMLINGMMTMVADIVRGEHTHAKGDVKLHVSPRLAELYSTLQNDIASSASQYFGAEYATAVEEEVRENKGICLVNFQSSQVFKGLMHREVSKLKPHALKLLHASRAIVAHLLSTMAKTTFSPYPILAQHVATATTQFLESRELIITDRLEEFIMQEDEIFTINSYYLDTASKIKHALTERLQSIIVESANPNPTRSAPLIPQQMTIIVNDLTIMIPLTELVQHTENSALASKSASSSSSSPSSGASKSATPSSPSKLPAPTIAGVKMLLHSSGASILEMQINAYAYTSIMHKRLCDSFPLMIRFHLLHALTKSPATLTALASAGSSSSITQLSLASRLQREFIDMSDKSLVDCMKEEASIASRRDGLTKNIDRMEKAMIVFDKLEHASA